MNTIQIINELNKINTIEHGHLGMYKNHNDFDDRETRWALKRFYELEIDHIEVVNKIIKNLGGKPSLIAESGDIIGKIFGTTVNLTSPLTALSSFNLIEKKSSQSYLEFINKLEKEDPQQDQLLVEFLVPNMLDADLMHLWLNEKIKEMER